MKFTNYHNFMQAITGLVQGGWTLVRMELDGSEIIMISLYHNVLELSFTLEHHANRETFDASQLKPFIRNRRITPQIRYEREQPFGDVLPVGNIQVNEPPHLSGPVR